MSGQASRRHGFTLVEMLVVIFIIGVLAALLLPAIAGSISRAQVTHMAFEIGGLKQAVDAYKQAKGDYPPNFSEGDYTNTAVSNPSVLRRHLQVAYPKADPAYHTAGNASNFFENVANNIDEAESLVFWLSSTVDDIRRPLDFNSTTLKHKIFFEFDERRLDDYDGDGFFAYKPKYAKDSHYVYFDSRAYGSPSANAPTVKYNQKSGGATAMPYFKSNYPNPPMEAIAKDSYQIICAGRDGDFGPFPAANAHKDWTFAKEVTPVTSNDDAGSAELDNITSFSDSKELRELLP